MALFCQEEGYALILSLQATQGAEGLSLVRLLEETGLMCAFDMPVPVMSFHATK